MYQIGDYVFKINTGVCRIEDIVHLNGRDIDKNRLYYLLIPMFDNKTRIYISTEREPAPFRKIMDEKEAWELIKEIPQIKEIKIRSERQREQEYKDAIRSNDPKRWVSIIKTMYLRKKKRTAEGKKDTSLDGYFFKVAEDYLYSELAVSMGKKKEELRRIIAETIQKQ